MIAVVIAKALLGQTFEYEVPHIPDDWTQEDLDAALLPLTELSSGIKILGCWLVKEVLP